MPESDNITLVTADEPPQRYIVSRSRLTVLSGVFRDLLSTPTTAEDKEKAEIPLTEKASKLIGFLAIIGEEEEKLEGMALRDWISLAIVADKYDCKTGTREANAHAWRLIANGDKRSAFFLATRLDNCVIVQHLAYDAIKAGWHDIKFCPDAWRDRLEASLHRRHEQVRDALLAVYVYKSECEAKCTHKTVTVAWNAAAFNIIRRAEVTDSIEKLVRKQLEISELGISHCKSHTESLCNLARKVDCSLPQAIKIVDSA